MIDAAFGLRFCWYRKVKFYGGDIWCGMHYGLDIDKCEAEQVLEVLWYLLQIYAANLNISRGPAQCVLIIELFYFGGFHL